MIQITGLVDMYFDTVVVEVQTFLLLFRLALAIMWSSTYIIPSTLYVTYLVLHICMAWHARLTQRPFVRCLFRKIALHFIPNFLAGAYK